ncbi:MAG: glycogen-binding domain-containing protein [bacterium]
MEKKIVKKKVAAPKKAAAPKKVVAPKKTPAAKKPAASRKTYTFTLHAPHARSVEVVGDFNNWEIGKYPMKKDANGIWAKAVVVKPGEYHYKYMVDGEWWLDPEKETAANPYGTENNVLVV